MFFGYGLGFYVEYSNSIAYNENRFYEKGLVMVNNFRLFALIAFIVSFPSLAFSFQGAQGCRTDCMSCHSLSEKEAGDILKIKVTKISEAPVKGLWQVDGTQNGKKVRVYLDFAKRNVLLITGFIPVERIGKPPELRKVDVNSIPLSGAIVMGDPKAKKRVIVFTDPDCPYCRKLHQEVKEILKTRKDIAFYIKLFPLKQIHPHAYEKSKSILCGRSLKLLDDALEGKDLPKADCEAKELDDNIKLAEKLGIGGTPTIILPDGRLIPGYVDRHTLLGLIDLPPK